MNLGLELNGEIALVTLGCEPATLQLQVVCSNQMSHTHAYPFVSSSCAHFERPSCSSPFQDRMNQSLTA